MSNANSFSRLKMEQKKFIRAKVIELGSVEAVQKFYSKNYTDKKDLVERFAHSIAKKIFC